MLPVDGALRALEVNPLWVDADQVEALDVLVITESAESAATGSAATGSAGTESATEPDGSSGTEQAR